MASLISSITTTTTTTTGSLAVPSSLQAITIEATAAGTNGPLTFPSTVAIPTTTLQPSQTALPTQRPPLGCGLGILTIPDVNPACAMPALNSNSGAMLRCCGTAPRIVYADNCNIYCQAVNQSLQELNKCLYREARALSNSSSAGLSILCNRVGQSYSSLVPSSVGNPTTTTANAAARCAEVKGLSAGGWAVLALVVAGGFVGIA